MEFILLGTSGHVDHGKSTLIKALSGIDPDRLKEEKEREMTIDIGFANFLLPSGRCAQVIDVPGHERFVKNMLTGVNTIDLVLFIVDAKEGVKQQTWEHFNILTLLDIKTGIIVITKIDLAKPERLDQTINEITELVSGSFLEKAPIARVSSVTGEGIQELIQMIDTIAQGITTRNKNLPVRFPVDRVFSMTGSGTIVTGTLISGTLRIGDTLELLPQRKQVRVRQMQSYGGKITEAIAGQRLGINMAGFKKEDLVRGDILITPGYIESTYMFDAALDIVMSATRPFKNNTRVRLHIGTGEFLGRVVLLDKEKIEPGQQALMQFRSEVPLAVVKDDKFVIRLYSPLITVGGGRIIDAHPVKHKPFQEDVTRKLKSLASASPEESVVQILMNAGQEIFNLTQITDKVNLPRQEVEEIIKTMEQEKEVLRPPAHPDFIMHIYNFNLLKEQVIERLKELHRKQPLKSTTSRKDVKSAMVKSDEQEPFFEMALSELVKEGKIHGQDDSLKLTEHIIQLTPEQETIRKKIENFYLSVLFAPPDIDVLIKASNLKPKIVQEVVSALKEMGVLVALSDGIVLHQEAIKKASEQIKEYLSQHENIKAGEFTKLLKTSRKYGIPLIEYLDSIKVTKRVGDVRIMN